MKQSDRERQSDEALAVSAQRGDAESMDELIERYKNFVKSRARGLFLLGSEPEDVVQEGMIGLFKAVRDFDAERGGNFLSFARVCIYRQLYTAIKLSNRNKHIPLNNYVPIGDVEDIEFIEQFANPEEALISREETERFSRFAGARLSALERGILEDYLAGMSYEEISGKQGVTKKAIDNALQRIKRKWNRESRE